MVLHHRVWNHETDKYVEKINWVETLWVYFGISVVVFIIFSITAGIVYATRPSHTVWYSDYDYLKAAGLDVSKSYHLRLGAPTGGTVGSQETTTTSEFFLFAGSTTTSTTSSVTPSSAVRLGFRNGSTSYILEIPYSKVRFHQVPDAQSKVVFTLWLYDGLDKRVQHNVGANYWLLQRGHPSRKPVRIQETYEWYYTMQDLGLSRYLNKYLAWVDLYLTPAQYSAYLGSIEPVKG